MTVKIINGIEYIYKDIPGEGKCLVPKKEITIDDLHEGAVFKLKNTYEDYVICVRVDYGSFLLIGKSGNRYAHNVFGFNATTLTKATLDYLNNQQAESCPEMKITLTTKK